MGNSSQQISGQFASKGSHTPPQAAIDVVRNGKSSEIWDPLARMVRVVKVTEADLVPKAEPAPEPQKDSFDLFLEHLAAGKVDLHKLQEIATPAPVPEPEPVPTIYPVVEEATYNPIQLPVQGSYTAMNVATEPKLEKRPVRKLNLKLPQLPSKKIAFTSAVAMSVLVIGVFGIWKFAVQNDSAATAVLGEKTVVQIDGVDTGEQPVTIKVVDKTKVSQEFLGSAENGDKVLLYYKSKKAVLYRPRTNEIIKNGEFTPPPPRVFVRQGTEGKTTSEIQAIISGDSRFKFESADKSPTLKHSGIILVDVTKRYGDELNDLAKLLNATIQPLPEGETPPDADFLVIVGK